MAQATPRSGTGKAKADAASGAASQPRRRSPVGPADGARPAPSLTILETRILRGPNYWAREPVVRMVVDLGVLEDFPSNKIPGFTDALVGPPAEPRGPRLQPRPARRVHHPPPRGDVGRPHRRAHRPRAPEPRRHRRPPRQDPEHRRARPLQRHLRVPRGGGRASRPASSPSPSSTTSSRPTTRRSALDFMAELERLIRLAEQVRLRAVDPGDPRRGGQPRHPVHPARSPLPRPARPGRPPAADPGDDDLEDLGDRRRHRERQEPDQPTPRLGRPARPEERGRRRPRRTTVDGGPPDRLPVRRQAARRQPRPGRPPRPASRRGRPGRVPRRPRPEPAAATSSSRATSPATTTAAS